MISIIVPVYNMAAYLSRCVDSLRGQTYTELEIILVDDGGTDESGAMCDRYAEMDERVVVIHKENGGLVSAWQAGVELSKGEYLCFVDADDWVETEMLAAMSMCLENTQGEIVCCNHTIDRADQIKKVAHSLPPGVYEGATLAETHKRLLGNEAPLIVASRCMKLLSRELITDNLKYSRQEIVHGEDYNIIIPALLSARRLVIMEDAYYYHYFYNEESMVHGYAGGLQKDYRLLCRVLKSIFASKANEGACDLSATEIAEQCGRQYVLWLLVVLKNEARGQRQWHRYKKSMERICYDRKNRHMVRKYPVKVSEPQNSLLYATLKHPCTLSFALLRIATIVFYKVLR
jgi:glycosyltransferase involved in cell wall biosynthesis